MEKETGKLVRLWSRFFFGLYILLLIYFMFFSEEWGRSIFGGDYRYNLVPFREIRRYLQYGHLIGCWRVMLNLGGNVVGFMPFGALLPAVRRKPTGFWRAAFFSMELSLLIELSQLVLQAGSCDVDDLLLNTLGGCIGYGLHRLAVFWRMKC
ncbi:MAG: VanZ family protein [Eubacteriales bacterium]|nr:VanZ family protein [Eubacteriales bacterium]